MPVASTYAVGPCEVLAVIADKVEVVQCVMCRSINHILQRVVSDHVGIVNEDGPEIDQDEEDEVKMPLKREEEDEKMIWH